MLALTRWCSRIPLDFPSPEHSTVDGYHGAFAGFLWGGSEEEIIAKGSPWPQELSRVLATLLQITGIPSRLVFLYRVDPPHLHTVVEGWALAGWSVCDPCANRCYIWPHHGYASARALQQHPRLVDQTPEHGRCPYVDSAFYRTVAIATYPADSQLPDAGHDLRPVRQEDLPLLREAAAVFTPA